MLASIARATKQLLRRLLPQPRQRTHALNRNSTNACLPVLSIALPECQVSAHTSEERAWFEMPGLQGSLRGQGQCRAGMENNPYTCPLVANG